jgi:hypothetical protein
VRGDVVEVGGRAGGVLGVGPLGVLRAGVDGVAVLVHAVLVVRARDELGVMAVVAAGMPGDAVEDRDAVLQVLHVSPQLVELAGVQLAHAPPPGWPCTIV